MSAQLGGQREGFQERFQDILSLHKSRSVNTFHNGLVKLLR